ncbi:MAG: phosphate acyltransferase PlsX [Clostridia bacterium]|nr:phosphate acyltransferase PlsX [Clostridia bacterium]
MKIIVDAFGGDHSPSEIIKGAVLALQTAQDFSVVLAGKEDVIKKELNALQSEPSRIEILDAPEVITNDDQPTEAVRKKRASSIVAGLRRLADDEQATAFVSAGSTGAVLTAATILIRRIPGIIRPALAPVLPTVKGGHVMLVDCGANADCKPVNLHQFAYMGSAYAKAVLGIPKPKIGLLSNGTEDKKGNELNKEVFPLLKEDTTLTFAGNIEAREILSGDYDVVVADGFSGNIALKACEGTALSMFSLIKEGIMQGGLRAKLGYLLLKPVFRGVKKVMDYNDNGGAVLLGLSKVVVKSHGSSKAKSIAASVLQAKELAEKGVVNTIAAYLTKKES